MQCGWRIKDAERRLRSAQCEVLEMMGHSQEQNKPSASFIARAQRRKLVVERGEAAAEGGSVFARHLAQRVFANHCRTSPRVEAIGCFPLLTTITALGTPGT